MRKVRPATLVLALTLCLTPRPTAAQAPESVFGESIEVRVVNLEVVVTDRKGHLITDLGPEDFRLEIDRQAFPIDYFAEIDNGTLAAPQASPVGAVASTPTVAGLAPGEPVGTSYLVFVDDYFTILASRRDQVLRGIAESLSRLGPADRMAVVAFDGRKLTMLSSWSRSTFELRAALEQAMGRRPRGLNSDLEGGFSETRRGGRGTTQAFLPGGVGPTGVPSSNPCAAIQSLEHRIERLIFGVTSTLRSFARPPGRKVMLLLSGGWPSSASEYYLGSLPPIGRDLQCGRSQRNLFNTVTETANLLGYTLYPIDVPGRTESRISAAEVGTSPAVRIGADALMSPSMVREDELHATLFRLADRTGGRAMLDGARLSAFDSVVDDTRSYYWLGFTPDWQGDDENHTIRLEVLRPGLKVRARRSFQDFSRGKEVEFMMESALLFGELPGAGTLDLEIGLLPKGRRRAELPLILRIPMDQVTMVPHDGGYVAELELRVGAIDQDGNRNEISAIPVKLTGDGPPEPGSYSIYEFAIRVQKESQDLVVTLRDPLADRILTAVTRIES